MFEQEVKTLYNSILSDKNCSVNLKIQVLKNLQTYLQEEDTRMQQADRDCKCWVLLCSWALGKAEQSLTLLHVVTIYPHRVT